MLTGTEILEARVAYSFIRLHINSLNKLNISLHSWPCEHAKTQVKETALAS